MGGLIDAIGSDSLKLAKMVAGNAPVLASLMGSPLASVALGLLAKSFNVDNPTVTSLIDAIGADPDSASKIQIIEAQNAPLLAQLAVSDKMDARKYGAEYKDFLRHLAYFVSLGFFCALFLMFIPLNISSEEKNLLSLLVGMLASKWQTIIDFFYGSSSPNRGV